MNKEDDLEIIEAVARSQEGVQADQKAEKEKRQLERDETTKDHLARVLRLCIWGIFGIVALLALVYSFQLILPEELQWLSKDSIDDIEKIIFGGLGTAVGAFVGKYSSKLLAA